MTEFLAPAERELEDAALWYELQEEGLGLRFWDAVLESVAQIEERPTAWPAFTSEAIPSDARRFVMKTFPFSLIYVVRNQIVVVLAVTHGRRRPDYWVTRLAQVR